MSHSWRQPNCKETSLFAKKKTERSWAILNDGLHAAIKECVHLALIDPGSRTLATKSGTIGVPCKSLAKGLWDAILAISLTFIILLLKNLSPAKTKTGKTWKETDETGRKHEKPPTVPPHNCWPRTCNLWCTSTSSTIAFWKPVRRFRQSGKPALFTRTVLNMFVMFDLFWYTFLQCNINILSKHCSQWPRQLLQLRLPTTLLWLARREDPLRLCNYKQKPPAVCKSCRCARKVCSLDTVSGCQ